MSDTLRILTTPRWQFFTDAGAPASGYHVYTYEPGTTTNKATYQDADAIAAHTNPIVLNARGEETIFWDGLYKIAVYTGDKDVDGVLVYQEDDYGVNVQTPTIGNYVLNTNGDFETATADPTLPDSWDITTYTDGTAALDDADQYSGGNSLKFASVGTGGGYAESVFFSVQEAKNLAINWAMKSSVADVRNVVEIIWYTNAQVQISTSSIYDDSATNPTSWTAKVASATPPSTARFGKIRITGCHSSDSTVGNTHFDNVIVAQHADGDGSGLVAGLVGSMTQAQLDTLEALTTAEIQMLDASAQAVAGYVYSNIYMIANPVSIDFFNVSAVIGISYESVGPTGSGATNIWTGLDNIPLSASYVEVNITMYLRITASTTGQHYINYRETGSSGGTELMTHSSEDGGSSVRSDHLSKTIKIPLDSSNTFEISYYADASLNSKNVSFRVIGYGL